jgi:hypothetical protein
MRGVAIPAPQIASAKPYEKTGKARPSGFPLDRQERLRDGKFGLAGHRLASSVSLPAMLHIAPQAGFAVKRSIRIS